MDPKTPPAPSSFPSEALLKALAETLARVRELAPGLGLLGVVLFFTLQTPNFWSPQTMTAITTIASTVGIVAIGVTFLMISGEFDLSVGQNFAFTPIIWAILFVSNDMNEWLALAIALAFGAGVGVVNGFVHWQQAVGRTFFARGGFP